MMFIEERLDNAYMRVSFLGVTKKLKVHQPIKYADILHVRAGLVDAIMNSAYHHAFVENLHGGVENKLKQLYTLLTLQELCVQASRMLCEMDEEIRDRAKQYRDYATHGWLHDFLHHSNHIEGSRIPYQEIKLILETGYSTHHIQQEIQEVKNSQNVWQYLQKDFRRNESHIKRVYHLLTQGLLLETGAPYPKGRKKINIIVGNSTTTDRTDVPRAMKHLLKRYKTAKKTLSPLQLAFDFHYRFECVHPFRDGNGRIGRLLMNKILISKGLPPMIIFSDQRTRYFNAIEKGSNDMRKYYKFMIQQYVKSLELVHVTMNE